MRLRKRITEALLAVLSISGGSVVCGQDTVSLEAPESDGESGRDGFEKAHVFRGSTEVVASRVLSEAVEAGRGWSAGWVPRFCDPVDDGSWAVLDCRLGRRILDQVNIILEAANLFDRQVTELHGVPLPGRWVSSSVVYRAGGP